MSDDDDDVCGVQWFTDEPKPKAKQKVEEELSIHEGFARAAAEIDYRLHLTDGVAHEIRRRRETRRDA